MEKLLTYRYIFKTDESPDSLGVRIITDVESGHESLMDAIRNDQSIVSCIREYVEEVDCSKLGYTEPVKQEVLIEKEKK